MDMTLPPDVEQDRAQRLQAFAESLTEKRDAAVSFKKATGIEAEWDEDENYYNGLDPFTVKPATYNKGRGLNDGLTQRTDTGADVSDNITAYHCDMRAARATDMLVPSEDKPFKIRPTPVPELTKMRDDPVTGAEVITNAQGQQTTMANAIQLMMKEAEDSAQLAELWIWDKFIEFGWHREFRKQIHEAHKIGCWAMKGPYPVRRQFKAVNRVAGQVEFITDETIEPASRAIDPRRLFPDPACYPSEDIQKGSYIWERDDISYRQLAELRNMKLADEGTMYLDDQITQCLAEGPVKGRQDTPYLPNDKDLFTIWYGYVIATKEDMEAAGCSCNEDVSVPAQITMVNDRVIQAVLSPLNAGEFPYDILVLDRRPGTPWGKGISRKVRVPQRQVNGLQRAWMKNAGLCAGPMMIFRRGKVFAADGGTLSARPYAAFDTIDEADDVSKAIQFIETPSKQAELLQGIAFALARGDQISGNAPQDQGNQNESPETARGRVILQNNSNAPQRQIARNADDGVIEPHVKRYYNYWLSHVEGDKGAADHQIEALGSSAFFERDAEQQFLLQVWASGLANNPEARIDVNKLTIELAKGNRVAPDRIRYTDEEWKAKQEQMKQNPPPPDPALQVAQLRAASAEKIAQGNQQVSVQKAQLDTDRDTAYVQAEGERSAELHSYNMEKLAL